jgi:hypothetical protein
VKIRQKWTQVIWLTYQDFKRDNFDADKQICSKDNRDLQVKIRISSAEEKEKILHLDKQFREMITPGN